MSGRMNVSGFSMGRMQSRIGSGDEAAIARIRADLSGEPGDVLAIVERAIRDGVPFPELVEETEAHAKAASALAADGQEFLATAASTYPANALLEGIVRPYGRIARPDVRGFFRTLTHGQPMFGEAANAGEDGSPYAAVPLAKLQGLRRGLAELREQVVYRVARRKAYDKGRVEDTALIADFCDSIDQIIDARLDLWFTPG